MKFTEPKPPTEGVSRYDHVMCDTPLGLCLIEWKGWKESDSYSISIGDEYIGEGYYLSQAKEIAKNWLIRKNQDLTIFLDKAVFAFGASVKVLHCFRGHEFEIGEIVSIVGKSAFKDSWLCRNTEGVEWYLHVQEGQVIACG
jgi:hypothetical protein